MFDRFASRTFVVSSVVALLSLSQVQVAQAADPAPTIRFLDVDSAAVGSFVGIYGRGFGTDEGRVEFDGVPAKTVSLWTDGLIIARVPESAKTGKIKVTTSDGSTQCESKTPLRIHAGKVYVVSPNGSDSAPGTDTAPFASLHKAMSVVHAGDTVVIRAGTYNEQDSSSNPMPAIYLRRGGTSSAPITWRGYGKDVPIIRGSAGPAVHNPIVYVGAPNIRLARLIVDGQGNKDSAVWINGSNVWAVGLEVRHFYKTGIGVDEVADVSLFENFIHDGTSRQDFGIWLSARRASIHHNRIENLEHGTGLRAEYSSQGDSNIFANVVSNTAGPGISLASVNGGNRIYDNVLWKTGESEGCHCAIELGYEDQDSGQPDHLYFNTIVGPTYRGVFASNRHSRVEMHSNIFSDVKAGIVFDDKTSQDAMSSSHNLWHASTGKIEFTWDGGLVDLAKLQGQGKEKDSLEGVPGLVDPENGDMHLLKSSPAIDKAGGPDKASFDFDGVKRPQGSASDIGAFEFVGAGGSSTGGNAGTGGAAGSGTTGGEAGTAGAQGGAAGAGTAGTAGGSAGSAQDGGTNQTGGDSGGSDDGGCGCSIPGGSNRTPAQGAWMLALAAAAALRFRRR